MPIYLNPEAFKDKAIPPIKNKEHIINITYSELKSLIDNSQLIPGMQYRITDYITTTTQENTQSANHPFDIIVIADKTNKLNCKARAIQHEGDTYFNESQLEKWELWYDIENNTNKYAWADKNNGKGIIYRMIDEGNNDIPYDFKNIQFKNPLDSSDSKYYYTFGIDSDNSLDSINHGCYNNTIKPYFKIKRFHGNIYLIQSINKIVFIDNDNHNNMFGSNCFNILFYDNCHNNIFGDECNNILFNHDCTYNIFENNCQYIIFARSITSVKYNYYQNNHFGNGCKYILFKGAQTASSSQQVQNYNIAQGLQGTSSSYLEINATRNLNYETKVGRNSEGVIKQYCIEDLIA